MFRGRIRIETLGLTAIVALVTALVAHYGLRVHTVQPDEMLALGGMRFLLHHGPTALWDWGHITDRGPERLTPIVLGIAHWLGGDTATGVRAERIAIALVYAGTALPAYLLARGLRLPSRWALAAAALAVLTPFAVFATSFLNSAAAYFTVPLAVWGVWRAIVQPSVRNDVLAIGVLVLAATARAGNLAVVAVLPVGVIAHLLQDRPIGRRRSLREIAGLLWRSHRVLVLVLAIGVLVLLVAGPTKLGGAYRLDFGAVPGRLRDRFGVVTGQLGVAGGYVVFVIAAAWVVRQALRPTSPRTGTFAWMAITAFVALVYASALAGPEERYIAPLFPLACVAFIAAVARRELGVLSIMLMAVVVGRAIYAHNPIIDIGAYTYFASPAGQFFSRVVLGKASLAIPWNDFHILRTVLLGGGVAVVLAAVISRRLPRAVAVALLVAAASYGLTSGVYNMAKFSAAAGIPGLRWEQQTWIDRAAKGQYVAIFDYDPLLTDNYRGDWNEAYVWNRSVIGTAYFTALSYGCCPPEDHHWEMLPDPEKGRFTYTSHGSYGEGRPLPRLLVWTPHFIPYGFDTSVVAQSDYLPVPLQLLHLNNTSRLLWSVTGATPDGYIPRGESARVRVFAGSRCVRIQVKAPPGFYGTRRLRIGRHALKLKDQFVTIVELRVRHRRTTDIIVSAAGGTRLPDKRDISSEMVDVKGLPSCAASAQTP